MTQALDHNKNWDYIRVNSSGQLLTSTDTTGFEAGKEFRTYLDFSITTGNTTVVKMVIPGNIVLKGESLSITTGELAFTAAYGGTEGGTFNSTLPIIAMNRQTTAPVVSPTVTLSSGGTHTGGTVTEVVRLASTGVGQSLSTVGSTKSDERGLGAITYYLRFNAVATCKGVWVLRWEEK